MAKHDRDLDHLLHALSDPTRRGFMEVLMEGPASVGSLAAPTGLSLPTVLRHVEVLEKAGLVRTEKKGRTRICHATPAPLRAVESWMDRQRAIWEGRLDRLESYLETLQPEKGGEEDDE